MNRIHSSACHLVLLSQKSTDMANGFNLLEEKNRTTLKKGIHTPITLNINIVYFCIIHSKMEEKPTVAFAFSFG